MCYAKSTVKPKGGEQRQMARASKDVNSYLLPTLEGFRNKLLDLTSRNNLLNLSLASKRTGRLMRFVACDPQAILNNLCSGYTLELKPLPDPPEEEEKKLEGEEFKAALVRAREQDPLYQQIYADSSDDKKFSPALAQAEDRLRSKVREEFEQRDKSSATKNLAKWAETQGINPSYDLSFSDKKPPSKNGTLQVLLLTQRLERLAESMRKSARSSIEETGNNILYLAFGCLEWSEKNKTFYAPLILLPVELIKSSTRGGTKSYSIRGTEDAPVGNVTLKERLRRDFLIDFPLPNLTEDGGNLKAYFDQVAEAVAEVDGWAVRPNLNLALLNFSGLGLYEDLDPQIVQSSALVKKLLAAELSDNEQGSESGIVAEDVHVDQPSIAEKVPILITQADASQFASIADVMSGRSMVIEGPPGTGKSQTITNIIANALYAGKRVLFVAEKKVALDVVYTRLSEAGLKPYCLRIASDKTNKREVYDELGERLLLPRPQPPRRDAALGEFNQLRDQLNSFSQLLNQSHGAEEESHQELLWAEVKLKQELQNAGLELAEFKVDLPAATAYTHPQVEHVGEIHGELAVLVASVDISELHEAFTAIGVLPADPIGRDQLFDQTQRWADALKELTELTGQEKDLTGLSLQALRLKARNDAEVFSKLPNPLPSEMESLLTLLCSAEVSGVAQDLFQALRAERASADQLASSFVRIPDPLPNAAEISNFAVRWNGWSMGLLSMPLIAGDRDRLGHRLELLGGQVERLQVACDAMGAAGLGVEQFNRPSILAIASVLGHLNDLPGWVLEQRSQPIWKADSSRLQDLLIRYGSMLEQRQSLGLSTSPLTNTCSTAQLRQASELLQLCCARGMADQLSISTAAKEWGLRISGVQALLDRIQIAVERGVAGHSLSSLTIEQLQALPTVLKAVSALSPNAAKHRNGQFWDAPLEAMVSTLQAKNELERTRGDLERDGLSIPTDIDAQKLREEAEVLETRKGLHKLLSSLVGSYKRASELAEKLGAKDEAQRPLALQRLADFLDQQAKYPNERESRWCSNGLSLKEAVSVAKELAAFKNHLNGDAATAIFLPLACTVPLAEVNPLLSDFEGGLKGDLHALVTHEHWAGKAVVGMALAELRSQLETSHRDQELLQQATPYAAWALAAGIKNGAEMADWFENVLRFQELVSQFPLSELEAIVGPSPDLQRHQEVLTAAKTYKELLITGGLGNLDSLLLGLGKPELEQLSGLISRQFVPLLGQLFAEEDLIPTEGEQQPVGTLLASVHTSIADYHRLVKDWLALGLQDGLSSSALLDTPLDLELHSRRQAAVTSASSDLRQRLGPELAGTAPETLKAVLAWITQLRELRLPLYMEQHCLEQGSAEYISLQRARGSDLVNTVKREEQEADQFTTMAAFSPQHLGGDAVKEMQVLLHGDVAIWLASALSLREAFPQWVRFHQLRETLPSKADRRLVQLLIDSKIPATNWRPIYIWNVVRSKLGEISEASPSLKGLQAADQVARRKRFHHTEDQLMQLDRAEVIAKIHRDRYELPMGIDQGRRGDFTELGLIDNETNKQKRHRPLRHLFHYAGNALRGLKPCWMMSPSTVASLVPREVIEQFDLVIADEASQMPPERAFGVISRAKQCVVVGDPKQLPPTSFFMRSSSSEETEDSEEVDNEALDEESILDLCTKSFKPVRRLKWHYRSRHGSLIAFSNRQFYNNQLVVFPSCDRDFAINRHLVEAPRYVRSINLPEVTLVCDVVLEQLELHPERSLGVVAMNESQAEEISEQLETLSIHHEELRRRLDLTDSSEELFVKSLEKVQGDERDTIVISTTYGPQEPGSSLAMRFGPINQAGGHRRLNVLFTRAKHSIELVTSMESSQIHPTATSSLGVHALKDYLKYVETRSLDTGRQTGRPPDSDFEVVVAEALERHGYQVECQVGVANYFIDLAVLHPKQSDLYLLGVECDGATYHSARAARDRDKYRQSVLENLGWKIYRIWSTDWFENPEAETRKLVAHLKKLSLR
jgi:very-short-patch-repair endonuclease